MSEDIDRLIEGLGGRSSAYGLTTPYRRSGAQGETFLPVAWVPQIETIQKANALVLRADLPGLKPDEVNVSIDDGILAISGERKQEHEEKREGFMRSERSYGTFYRAIALPEGADEDKINAQFKHGVLEVTVPLSGRERGRRIKVDS